MSDKDQDATVDSGTTNSSITMNTRRSVLRRSLSLGTILGISGVASAQNSSRRTQGSKSTESPDTTVLHKADNYRLLKTEYQESTYVGKVYIDGPKEGQIEETKTSNKSIEPSSIVSAHTDETATVSTQAESLSTVIEKSTEIEKMTDNCTSTPQRCEKHYFNVISIKLSEPADALGKGLLTTVISQLITLASSPWAKVLSGYAGTVAGVLLSFGTSDEYTFGIMDIDTYGGTWPKGVTAASKSYGSDEKSELTQIRGPTIHQGHFCEDPDNRV